MVRAGPDVDEDERPEMDHREPVGVNGTLRRLRDEVVHDAEDRRGEEEGYGVVPVPPLDKGVLHASEYRVAVREAGWQRQVVDDVQHRHRDDRSDVKPDRDVEAGLTAPRERPEKIDAEDNPDERYRDVDRPDQFGIFLPPSEAEWERDGRGHDDGLPSPEMQRREKIAGES